MRDAGMVFHHLVVRVPRLGARVPGGCPGDPIGGGGALHGDIKRYRQQDFRTLAVPEGRPSS
jgi:hypothetical protein